MSKEQRIDYIAACDGKIDYGHVAWAQIVKRMEDNRGNLVIVMSGYTKEMAEMVSMNSGLKLRFNLRFDFPDYSTLELLKISQGVLQKNALTASSSFESTLSELIEDARVADGQKFGNGRFMRNVIEAAAPDVATTR